MAGSSVLVIEELAGQRRRIELRGPGLPFQGAEWGVDINLKTRWYPGNPTEATQHVLVAEEVPSQWEGFWRRTMMGRTPSVVNQGGSDTLVTSPAFMADTLEDVARRSSRLRVTWTQTDDSGTALWRVVREGRLKTFKFKPDRAQDIGWTANFEWVGRGGSIQKVVATRDGNLDALTAGIEAAVNDAVSAATAAKLVATKRTFPKTSTSLTLGQLEALTQAPNKLLTDFTRSLQQITSKVKQVGDIVKKLRAIPAQLANTSLAFATNTVAIANQFHDAMSRRPAELNSAKGQAADLARSTKYFWQTLDTSAVVARRAWEMQQRMQSPVMRGNEATMRTVLAVYQTRQGDTLQSISMRFYQSADHGVDIARSNHLPWTTVNVDKGKILIIPVLGASPGSQIGV